MSSRDEQYEALKAAVKNAESKLKSAEMSVKDIEDRMKLADEAFEQKLAEKTAGYKKQTGADFSRTVDENGRVTYSFSRETTEKERKKRRNLILKRQFDSETGEVNRSLEFKDSENQSVDIHSAKNFEKPKSRKKFIAFNMFGIRRMDISTEVNNPFLNTVGKPIIVPIQVAAKLTDKISSTVETIAKSSVGTAVSKTAKVAASPIIIPAKIIKDISDKGGVIHSVVDLGDRIQIEGFNAPKPVKTIGNVTTGALLGLETASNIVVDGAKKFTIEVAKEKIFEEINKGISENEATQAAFVIGMKLIDIYRILDEHTKYKRAFRRDKAGDDVVDTNVSRYLAEKNERKYQKNRDNLTEQKAVAEYNRDNANIEYESAKARLETYEKTNGIKFSDGISPKTIIKSKEEKTALSKIDKKIERTKRNLKLNKEHKYKVCLKRVAVTDKHGTAKTALRPIVRYEETVPVKPATAWETAKKLDGLAVGTAVHSLRRKAIRDGNDNVGVETVNFAVTAVEQGKRYIKTIDEKERQYLEKKLQKKLKKLENQKKLLTESESNKPKPKGDTQNKKKPTAKETQKRNLKKRQNRKVHSKYVEQAKQSAKELLIESVKKLAVRSKSLLFIVLPLIIVVLASSCFTMCGMPMTDTIMEQLISPCSTNDLGLCDRYYTELGKNMIEQHQNIESFYPDYDKYVCLTEIDKISHSPEKLLPYTAIKTLSANNSDHWTFEQAMPYIEDIFNAQYEFYTNEIHETRKNVTTVIYTNEDSYYSALGKSVYSLERPSEDIPNPLESWGYIGYANTYTHVEVPVFSGYIENTLDSVGVFTDKDGNTSEYEDMQTFTFYNYWSISLVYDWFDDHYEEYWVYKEERQEYFEFDYFTLEYAIKENNIDVPDNYWTDTDENWQDNNFDKLIYNRVCEFDDSEKQGFSNYYMFRMGHQELKLPFESPEIAKYSGYNNDINGDMSLDYSMELRTYQGQEIVCGMDGEITAEGENSFSVHNSKYGTLYYDYAVVPDKSKAEKGETISASTGDILRITFVDNDGNYLNPLFIFS